MIIKRNHIKIHGIQPKQYLECPKSLNINIVGGKKVQNIQNQSPKISPKDTLKKSKLHSNNGNKIQNTDKQKNYKATC